VYGFNNHYEGNGMGLSDSINNYDSQPGATDCYIAKIINSMPAEDKKSVENAIVLLRNSEAAFSRAWLLRKILDEGYKMKSTTFRNHVKGECTCEFK